MNDHETPELSLIRAVREIPDEPAPDGFVVGVLYRLTPKRLPWWRRAWIWTRTPRPLVVTPLRMAGVSLAAALLILAALPMMHSPQAPPFHAPSPGLQTVTFMLSDPQGQIGSAAVIGSFNRWRPRGFEMHFSPDQGAWLLETRLPAGTHEYVFLLDGAQVRSDPRAFLTKDDGFGSRNAVLLLTENHEHPI